jgi:hypothetical protein
LVTNVSIKALRFIKDYVEESMADTVATWAAKVKRLTDLRLFGEDPRDQEIYQEHQVDSITRRMLSGL